MRGLKDDRQEERKDNKTRSNRRRSRDDTASCAPGNEGRGDDIGTVEINCVDLCVP